MPQFWNLGSLLFSSLQPNSIDCSNDSLLPDGHRPPATSTPKINHISSTSVLTIPSNSRCNKTNQSKCKDEITVVVANCDGVTGKQSSIENMLTSLNPDIFLAVKTKLDDSVYNAEFVPSHYVPFRKDRKRGGGGVLVATRENIVAEPLPEFDVESELWWVKIFLVASKTLIVDVFYCPPDSSLECLHEFNTSLLKVRARYPDAVLKLGGDFNLPGIDWSSLSHIPSKAKK